MEKAAVISKQEVTEEKDYFHSTAEYVEKLDAEEAVQMARDLIHSEGTNDFSLGGALACIQGNKYWKQVGQYESFKDFIKSEFGMDYRKAMYLITIYTGLVESQIKYADVADIGWSKLKEIAKYLTKENAKELIAKAREYTLMQLQAYLAHTMKGGLPSSGEDMTEHSKLSTLAFKVHADQKETIKLAIEKAKVEAETEFPAVALEAICLNYLTGGKVKPESLKETMMKHGFEAVMTALDAAWPDVNIQVTLPIGGIQSSPKTGDEPLSKMEL